MNSACIESTINLLTDNVHFQNTAQLVHVLTESEIQFHLQVNSSNIVCGLMSYLCSFTLMMIML